MEGVRILNFSWRNLTLDLITSKHPFLSGPEGYRFVKMLLIFTVRKVLFLHLSVILFTGGVSATSPRAYTPQTTPLSGQTPPPPGQTPPLGRPPWQTPPWPVLAGIHTPPCPVHAGIHIPPAQCMLGYGQQAGGTHPCGMHSFLF